MRIAHTLACLLALLLNHASADESPPPQAPRKVMVKRFIPNIPGNSPGLPQSTPITPACPSPNLAYYNGPLVSNVQVVPVMWGTYVDAQITSSISQFYADATVSNWYDMLSEYASTGASGTNQSIGRGTAVAAVTIAPSSCALSAKCTVTDLQIQTELSSQIAAGHLPPPQFDGAGHTNTAYMMYFPPNVTVNGSAIGVGTSCVDFCAYHSDFLHAFGSGNVDIPYSVLMDTFTSACAAGCGSNATPLDNETSTSSHELSELVTDTDVGIANPNTVAAPIAWYDQFNNCGEIGDICDTLAPGSTITVDGRSWVVQQLWSNAQNACVGAALRPTYAISAPATAAVGATFPFSVTAMNPAGNRGTDIAYAGTAHFTSTSAGTLPADFTFAGTPDQGTAGFAATLNTLGTQTITATDMLNAGITGTASISVVQDNTTTSLTSSANPSISGQQITLTATVAGVSSALTPTGLVTFFDGANLLGSISPTGGIASLPTSALASGNHTITANYAGDANFNGSSGALATNPQVVLAVTTTGLSTTCSTTFVENQSIPLTAAVSGSGPTGTVAFADGANMFCSNAALDAVSGIASCAPTLYVQGGGTSSAYNVTASYSGDSANASSASSSLTLTVLSAADVIFHGGFEVIPPGCPAQ